MTEQSLIPFFDPKGVAVIGVSRDPTKLGYGLARNLVQSGYQGAVHFVNPKGDRLLGAPIYPSVLNVPDPVDLAVLLVPPPFVPDVLKECAGRGIHAAIIATGGFRETGPEGAALEIPVPRNCACPRHPPDRAKLHRTDGYPPAVGHYLPPAAHAARR